MLRFHCVKRDAVNVAVITYRMLMEGNRRIIKV